MTENTQRPDDDASGPVVSEDGLVGDGVPGPIVPGDAGASDATADAVARLADADLPPAERRRALGAIAHGLAQRGFTNYLNPRKVMAWIGDAVVDVAPRIPVRSLEALRHHFPGLDDDQIADRLVRNAARTSAGIGAVGGGVTAIQWAAPPTLLTAPVVLAAETVAVVAVEIKLIGELQELYGQSVPGGHAQRALSLLQAWAGRRGVSLLVQGRGVAAVLGTAAPARAARPARPPVRPQPHRTGPTVHRRGGGGLPQSPGDGEARRGGPQGPGQAAPAPDHRVRAAASSSGWRELTYQ